jgi:ribosomal protein L29
MARCWGVARGVSKGDFAMTRNKDLKRLVRTRMKKTGEAYTTARAQITRKTVARKGTVAASAPAAASDSKDYATLAGMSDAAIKQNTGCTWERWVKSLDYHGAATMSHGDIARLVSEKYKVPSWWTQTVTVGYERIKGLRARGQRRDGSYEATKSRTFNVPVTKLFSAWKDANIRRRWLDEAGAKVRTATEPKSMRLGWSDGTIVAVGFYPKGATKSSVAVQHTKLPDRETADRLKQYWLERFDALADVLAER